MIIDIHTHAWPDKVSLKAREALESHYAVKFVGDPTIQTLVSFMEKNEIDISCVCAVASRPEQVVPINDWLFSLKNPWIKIFAALHPDHPDWKNELQRIRKNTFGIKLQPSFQEFYVDDEKVFPVYEELERLGLIVLFHSGDELSPLLEVRSTPKRLAKVREKFPGLKMIAAHFGGFKFWDEVREYLLGRDIYFDTSAFFGYLPDEEAKAMILKHRADRILFGTDFPIVDQRRDLDYLEKLGLPEDLTSKILSQNALALLTEMPTS